MTQLFRSLSILALIACAAPATSQETTPAAPAAGATSSETGAENPAAPEAPAVADPLAPSLGEQVDAADAPGTTYTKGTYDDWDLRCIRVAEGKEPCQLYQLLKDQQGNAVAEITLFGLPKGNEAVAGATIITPLETLLTQQITLSVDTGAGKRYPFSWCSQIGCFARIGLTAGDVASFKKGAAAKLVIVPVAAADQKVELGVSLKGFTAGYDAVLAEGAN